MAAILASLGFTFLIDRMTEVLTPDIYRAHWLGLANKLINLLAIPSKTFALLFDFSALLMDNPN